MWSFGFSDWRQYVSLCTSLFSLSWGSSVGHHVFISGNEKAPALKNLFLGFLCILPHTMMMTGGYSLLSAYGINLTAIVFSFFFISFFLLSAIYSDNFYSLCFSIFSLTLTFTPVLFTKKYATSDELRSNSLQQRKITRFYSLNKIMISATFPCCLIPLAFLMNSGQFEKSEWSSEYKEHGFRLFKFRIYQNNGSFAEHYACQDYCDVSSCHCSRMNITAPASSDLCTKI